MMYQNNDIIQLQVILSTQEKEQMKQLVNASGMKQKAWLRNAVIEKIERETEQYKQEVSHADD